MSHSDASEFSELSIHNQQSGDSASIAPQTDAAWMVLPVRSRVDSFNQVALTNEIKDLQAAGQRHLILDLRGNRFFSFQMIRFCVDLARELAQQGGVLGLYACPERTRRHFEIYGSLKQIRIFRSERELPSNLKKLGNEPPREIST